MIKNIFLTSTAFLILFCNNSLAETTNKKDDFEDDFAIYEAEFSKNNQKEIYDPLEKINRKIFTFNEALDRKIIEPIAYSYRNYTPKIIRASLHNFVTNLSLPISAFNSFAQGKVENGLATSSNFLINSTLGIGGFIDVAGSKNIKYNQEDFGQTLGYYGVKNGAYLVIPILGPSTGRDFGGNIFDRSLDPMSFNIAKVGGSTNSINSNFRSGNAFFSSLDLRESLLDPIADARKESFDLYATFRSVYIQQRDLKIKN